MALSVRHGGLFLLIVCCTWAAPLVALGGLHFTGDRLLGLAAVAALAAWAARHGLRWTPVHSALAVFTAVQVATSLLAASRWPGGPKFVSIYVLGFACFALTAEWAIGHAGPRRGARIWVAAGTVLGLAGAMITAAANLWQTPLWGTGVGDRIRDAEGAVRPVFAARTVFNEWNLYSSFLLVAFALALWAWPSKSGDRAPVRGGFLAVSGIALGLVFGLTRAAWLAMAGLGLFWLWRRRPTPRQVAALVAVVVCGFVLQAMTIGDSPLSFRVLRVFVTGRDQNLAARAAINRATIASWLRHPVVGNGAGSTNDLDVRPSRPGPRPKWWNGNMTLFVLHDSGLVGLAALLGLVAAVVVTAHHARGRSVDPAVSTPLLAAGVALLMAYQFTHALWLMYPYVYLGILTAALETDAGAG